MLRRAGVDDTLEDALVDYNIVVGDRTPRALQETYIRRGAQFVSAAPDTLIGGQALIGRLLSAIAPEKPGAGAERISLGPSPGRMRIWPVRAVIILGLSPRERPWVRGAR